MDGLKKKLLVILAPSIASGFLLLFTVFIAVFIVLGIFNGDNKSGSGTGTYISKGETTVSVCDENAAKLLAKIVYKEVGGTSLFAELNTASIVLNNAGVNTYEKIYALSDNNYANFSSYKNKSFEEVVPSGSQGEMLYVAEMVLTGKYSLPKNITLQASQDIVNQYGNIWTYVSASPMDVYFGYSGDSLATTDISGNTLSDKACGSIDDSVSYYKSLSDNLSNNSFSSYSSSSVCKSITSECGFTISSTSLSKTEFKDKVTSFSNSHSACSIFANNADKIYDLSLAKGLNPELVVVRAWAEGSCKATGGSNNYWGLACYNGNKTCKSYSSFMDGVEAYLNNISKYSSLREMMNKYANIGDYWYNPGSSGLGGCYYAKYIYPTNMPDRVKNACSGSKCGKGGGSGCVKTTTEDQDAYSEYQVKTYMAGIRKNIFGLEYSEGICSTNNYNVTSLNLSNIPVTTKNILTEDVSTFLKNNGSSVDEYNSYIYSSVRNAGLGSRNGVAAAGASMLSLMYTKYGHTFRYTWGGKYSGYGLNTSIGSTGFDCSGFVSWAIHNGGYKYVYRDSTALGNLGNKCRLTDSSCVGKAGDLIWHQGHIMLIVGVDSSNYYIAEAASTNSGMRIKKQGIHSDSSGSANYIVDMTNFYNDSSNLNVDNYPS